MQLFGLNTCPVAAATGTDPMMCDQHVVKMCTEAAQLAWSVAHTKMMPWVSERVSGPLGRLVAPWKPLSKGHLQHECFLWALADAHHVHWVIRHGLACCIEYSRRYAGKTHDTEWQLRHLARKFGTPDGECTLTPGLFLAFVEQIDPAMAARKFPDRTKFCETNPPDGCLFGILAGPSRISDDWVECYKAYYELKRETFKQPMRFTIKRERDTELEIGDVTAKQMRV